MFQGQDDFCQIETGRVLHENALTLQVHEQLAAAQILQYQVEFAARLEGVDQIHYKRVFNSLQDVSLCLSMGSVFLVPYDGCLLQHLHGKDVTLILSRQFPDLEHFAITTPAQHPPQFKVLGASFLCPRVDCGF